MDRLRSNIWRSAALLALFATVGTGLVAATYQVTRERIAASERAALIRTLHSIIAPELHDNDMLRDTIALTSVRRLGSRKPVTVYRARAGGRPVAAAITAFAPNGYGGAIKLLVGIRYDGTLTGVRVLDHHETPGLGDAIDADKSSWIQGFAGKSLQQPDARDWQVKKDGGYFDQFTGATITPRAVVAAVRNALLYFKDNRQLIFSEQPPTGDHAP